MLLSSARPVLLGTTLVVALSSACSDSGSQSSTGSTAAATAGPTSNTTGTNTSAVSGVGGTTATAAMGAAATSVGGMPSSVSSVGGMAVTTTSPAGGGASSTTTASGGAATTVGAGGNATTTTTAGGSGGGSSAAVLSDDFESVAAGQPPDAAFWQLRVPSEGNTIEVSAEQAHSGSQSVKVTGSSGSTMFYTQNVFPLPSGVVYFRTWARFSDAAWANHNAFVAASPGQESEEVRFGGQNNAYHANVAMGDGLSPDPYESPSCARCVTPVANEWTCLRGKLDFTTNAAELYVGDLLAVDSATDGWHNDQPATFPQNPTQIGFGWALYGAQANTVYYDDVAIGYEPIACQ